MTGDPAAVAARAGTEEAAEQFDALGLLDSGHGHPHARPIGQYPLR